MLEHPDGERTFAWLAEQVQATGQRCTEQRAREWREEDQPNERNVRAISGAFRSSPAWLRYGIGGPYLDDVADQGGYGRFEQVTLAVAETMGGMPEEEVAAEVVRRARRRRFGKREMDKVYRWLNAYLDYSSDDVKTEGSRAVDQSDAATDRSGGRARS